MPDNINQPLVSIIVITYNSAKFVLETLESVKAQTYKNIELIVTDDNSTDVTVEICNKWIEENNNHFVRALLVSSERNMGIPANINKAVRVAEGYWIKCIAGDDLLAADCITELIRYINSQQEDIQVLSTDIIRFSGNSIQNGELKRNPYTKFCARETSPREQYEMLLRTPMVFAATVIIRRELLLSLGGFDERFTLIEDWPLWLKITDAGYKMYYLDKPLIYYRIHDNNLSQTTIKHFLYHPMNKISISFKEKELIPRLPFIESWGLKHDLLGMKTCFFLGNNRKNPFTRFIFFLFDISNPFYNYLRIKTLLSILSNRGKSKILIP
jgi:glycosyltransferase involved in cell wall biosynthesis